MDALKYHVYLKTVYKVDMFVAFINLEQKAKMQHLLGSLRRLIVPVL